MSCYVVRTQHWYGLKYTIGSPFSTIPYQPHLGVYALSIRLVL